MARFLVWLSGGEEEILVRCPSERNRFVALGGAVLATGVMAAGAMIFAATEWFHVWLPAALLFGLFWGTAIMNLDRWLLIATRRQRTARRTIMLSVPRVLLALIVGFVIAEPLMLYLFKNEIHTQAVETQDKNRKVARERIEGGYVQIHALEKRQHELQGTLVAATNGAALSESSEYQALNRELLGLQTQYQKASAGALCELDGTCGTHQRGRGEVYDQRHAYAGSLKTAIGAKEHQLELLRGNLLGEEASNKQTSDRQATTELGRVKSELKSQRAAEHDEEHELWRTSHAGIGLLQRVEALGTLTSKHLTMLWERVLLTLFVLAFDTVPILFKTLTLLGKPSLYESVQDEIEKHAHERVIVAESERDEAHRSEAKLVAVDAEIRAKFERQASERLNAKIVAVQEEAANSFVEQWRKKVLDEVPDWVESQGSNGMQPKYSQTRFRQGAAPSGLAPKQASGTKP
jgi:Domain of unknown function (DUF4407)